MDNASTIWISLVPGLVILGLMLLALAVFLILQPKFEQDASRKSGSVLLPSHLIHYGYWLADGVIAPLGRLGVRPNHVTVLSVVLSAGAALLVAHGHLMSGAWVFFAAIACDLVDGLLARSLGIQSTSGAFFDSFCDRISEGVIFAGLAYLGRDTFLFAASFWALLASYMISYARSRGEGLGVDCKAGLMQRPERLLTLFFTLLLAPLIALLGIPATTIVAAGVSLIALLATLTAMRRASLIMGELGKRDADASKSLPPGNPAAPNPNSMAEASP